jgi:hypothetical protein
VGAERHRAWDDGRRFCGRSFRAHPWPLNFELAAEQSKSIRRLSCDTESPMMLAEPTSRCNHAEAVLINEFV